MPLTSRVDGESAPSFNDVVEARGSQARGDRRVADQVGHEGQLAQRMNVPPGATGGWADVIEARTTLIQDVSYPMAEVAALSPRSAKGTVRTPWSRGRRRRCAAIRRASALW